jgi:hypothetical protein
MATEAPDLAPRDWSITTQDDGTIRITRSDAWRTATYTSGLVRKLAENLGLCWLGWLLLQFPSGLRWITWLALPIIAWIFCLSILAAGFSTYRWIYSRQEWRLGTDFLEEHVRSHNGWRVRVFQECTVHLVEKPYFLWKRMWFLHLEGESAQRQGLAVDAAPPGFAPPLGYVLWSTHRRDAGSELQALGKLISTHTGWPFTIRLHTPERDANA